ncbi:multicopper oxidase family protein [Polyangium sp. y55x31]|uniref:multicopper oxidase family protein n=1 Tax=Polyangium sp. y55x31 TaxID=3042688 RepID=UPI002482A300|nr:multicopper oxidase family protein [Polyangium sp. y55x31]MDI1482514.1 multicopper oxidase family protein [Polyangium sp. y55x31]
MSKLPLAAPWKTPLPCGRAPLVLLGLLGLAGCGGPDPGAQPEGWDSAVVMRPAVDRNADPRTFEMDLEARIEELELRAGTKTPAWTYDGSIPGPFVRANVGDRLIVHFRNALPEPTTIHWHGLRIPAAMDGAAGHSQPEIQPGETFTYDFVLPDAGLYWYHPHVHSAAQLGFGLYGGLLVDDPTEPADIGDELVLVLSDIAIKDDGSLQDPQTGLDFGTLFGREGDLLLVNGKKNPVIEARAGRRQRWRIVNAAKSRYFQLAMKEHTFTRIGGDGGFMEKPVESAALVLTPGERADVMVVPRGAPGSTLSVRWVPYDRGYGTTFNRPEEEVFRVHLSDEAAVTETPRPKTDRVITPLDLTGATPVALELTQGEIDGKMVMGINGVPSWEAAPIPGMVGETQVWTVKNTMDFAHPFHLHGFFFQPLDASLAPLHPMEWKDTVNVPVDGTGRFAVRYDDRPGMWMFHCHILDHADAGMMGVLDLQGGSGSSSH